MKPPTPNLSEGIARNFTESKYPNLWRGLVGLWVPSLGVQGMQLWDFSTNKNHAAMNNMNAADPNNNTAQAAVSIGVAAGSSLSMTGGSSLYSYSIFGLFDSTSGQGRSLILMGYNKRS